MLNEISFSNEFIISKTEGTNFEKVAWNISVIENNPEKIKGSTVFLGPSLVLNGINDSLLSLNNIKSVNLAVNHLGNESMLFMVNRIKKLAPKEIVLFKNETPVLRSHQLAPLLFKSSELYKSGQGINFYFFEHLFKRLKFVPEYLIWTYLKDGKIEYKPTNEFGVRLNESMHSGYEKLKKQSFNTDETLNLYQNGFKYSHEKESSLTKVNASKREMLDYFWYETNLYNSNSQNHFFKSIKETCLDSKIKCSMIYIPKIKDLRTDYSYKRSFYREVDSDLEVYKIGSYEMLDDSTFWSDYQHLSNKGSTVFTNALISNKFFKE